MDHRLSPGRTVQVRPESAPARVPRVWAEAGTVLLTFGASVGGDVDAVAAGGSGVAADPTGAGVDRGPDGRDAWSTRREVVEAGVTVVEGGAVGLAGEVPAAVEGELAGLAEVEPAAVEEEAALEALEVGVGVLTVGALIGEVLAVEVPPPGVLAVGLVLAVGVRLPAVLPAPPPAHLNTGCVASVLVDPPPGPPMKRRTGGALAGEGVPPPAAPFPPVRTAAEPARGLATTDVPSADAPSETRTTSASPGRRQRLRPRNNAKRRRHPARAASEHSPSR